MRGYMVGAICCLASVCSLAQAQTLQVNRENRTISVSVTESVRVDPDIARVHIGYSNFGATQERAFQENVIAANRISEAILAAGFPRQDLHTQAVTLEAVYEEEWPEQWKKERKYQARQAWSIVVPVVQAQTIVDIAVAAGANEVEDVTWAVSDEAALQARAYSAALAKAHALATKMAKELNTKLGEVLYASNARPISSFFGGPFQGVSFATTSASVTSKEPQLRLFPQKVVEDATVYAVFAIE